MKNIYIYDKELAYPDKDYTHMIIGEKYHDYTYDKDFMYRLRGFKCMFVRFWMKVLFIIFVQPVCFIRYALIIKGKKNIRKYKKMANSKAMISICNHTTEWDSIFVMMTRYFRFDEFPIWQEGAESKAGMMYREAGGIVMPIKSMHGMLYAYKAMEDVLNEGKWLHVFPEAACWPFYPTIRSFQVGAFKLAYDHKLPILPMGVSYRAPKGIYKLFKKHANAKLVIGEPLLPNYDLPRKEAINDLLTRSRLSMMKLIGIDSFEENEEIRNSLKTYHVE